MNNVTLAIQKHLSLRDAALDVSSKVLFFAENHEIEAINLEIENRERLVNLISDTQAEIERMITALNPVELNSDDFTILKLWFADLAKWSDKMLNIDNATLELLDQQKEETGKEIGAIFKNKEFHKGYSSQLKK